MKDTPGCAGAVVALVLLAAIILIMWAAGAFSSASDNITCKKQQDGQYELCIAGQPHPVYVPYGVYRSARVGGYYDEQHRTVFRTVHDDPAAPHGVFGGDGEGHGGGFSEGGHGGGGE